MLLSMLRDLHFFVFYLRRMVPLIFDVGHGTMCDISARNLTYHACWLVGSMMTWVQSQRLVQGVFFYPLFLCYHIGSVVPKNFLQFHLSPPMIWGKIFLHFFLGTKVFYCRSSRKRFLNSLLVDCVLHYTCSSNRSIFVAFSLRLDQNEQKCETRIAGSELSDSFANMRYVCCSVIRKEWSRR